MSDFQAFTQKGGKYVTAKSASVSMNPHGYLNIPWSVREGVFDGAEYVVFHLAPEDGLLGLEGVSEDEAPPYAYTISGQEGESGTIPVEKALEAMGKNPPEKHTSFTIQTGDFPHIDASDLPEFENDD